MRFHKERKVTDGVGHFICGGPAPLAGNTESDRLELHQKALKVTDRRLSLSSWGQSYAPQAAQ